MKKTSKFEVGDIVCIAIANPFEPDDISITTCMNLGNVEMVREIEDGEYLLSDNLWYRDDELRAATPEEIKKRLQELLTESNREHMDH